MTALQRNSTVGETHADTLPALLRATAEGLGKEGSVPEDIEDPSSSGHAQLHTLTSHSLHDLRAQPAALELSRKSLESQLSALCSRHVHSFVRVQSATTALPEALSSFDDKLEQLIERELPALADVSLHFAQAIRAPLEEKHRARNLLEQYELSLKDLLDIPRLLMTCARANHPIEALQLGTHIARIAQLNNANGVDESESGQRKSALLKALRDECWGHLAQLREDLLRGLGARGVRLPAARRYVSLLSRFSDVDGAGHGDGGVAGSHAKLAVSSSAICLSFLRSRWILVEELGAHETDDDPHTSLSVEISSWRDVVSDTCSISLALFAERASGQDEQDEISPISLISSFGYTAITKLEELIARRLPKINGSNASSLKDEFEKLDTLHTQLSYAAASLSRQGLDFSLTSQARDAFERQAIWLWSKGVKEAVFSFEETLGSSSKLSVRSLIGSKDARDLLSVSIDSIKDPRDWAEETARFPPLSKLANQLLDTHEALLAFAPLSIGSKALDVFDTCMLGLISQVLQSFRKAENDLTASSQDIELSPLRSDARSSGDTQSQRLHQASLAVAARFINVLSLTLLPALQQLLRDTFHLDRSDAPEVGDLKTQTLEWTNSVEEKWLKGERARIVEAQEQEEKRLAEEEAERRAEEERRKREAARLEEEQRERARKEAQQREKEEKEAERRRQEEEKRQKEAAAAAELQRRKEESRRREAIAAAERQRQAEELRQREAAAAAERQRQEAEALQRMREEEDRQQKEREEAERAEQMRIEEAERKEKERKTAEEQRRRKEAEAEAERLRVEAEAEAEKRKEVEARRQKEEQESQEESDERAHSDATSERKAAQAGDELENRGTVIGQENAEESVQSEKDVQMLKEERGKVVDNTSVSSITAVPEGHSHQAVHAEVASTDNIAPSTAAEPAVSENSAASSGGVPSSDASVDSVASTNRGGARPANNRLAEKLRKRQEERAKAAAAAAAAGSGSQES